MAWFAQLQAVLLRHGVPAGTIAQMIGASVNGRNRIAIADVLREALKARARRN
jgi:hypothetical protein